MATKSRVSTGRGAKAKGSGWERELAAYLNECVGLSSKRALLSGGGCATGGSDLDGTPLIHVEAKRTETFAPYAAMYQAEKAISCMNDVVEKPFPVVMQRRNQMKTGHSLVVMRLDHWIELYKSHLTDRGVALDTQGVNSFLKML